MHMSPAQNKSKNKIWVLPYSACCYQETNCKSYMLPQPPALNERLFYYFVSEQSFICCLGEPEEVTSLCFWNWPDRRKKCFLYYKNLLVMPVTVAACLNSWSRPSTFASMWCHCSSLPEFMFHIRSTLVYIISKMIENLINQTRSFFHQPSVSVQRTDIFGSSSNYMLFSVNMYLYFKIGIFFKHSGNTR